MSEWQVVQEWQGYVEEVDKEAGLYSAQLVDITAGDTTTNERAEGMSIAMLNEEDRRYVSPGAIFTWKISERIVAGDISESKGEIIFNKDKWTAEEIEAQRKRGEELYKIFKFDWMPD